MNELIRIRNGEGILDINVAEQIARFEEDIKVLKDKEEKLKADILRAMEENGILKIDNEYLTISYIAPTDRETLDTKTLKADLPKLWDDYVKLTPVKSSIRIRVKKYVD